MNLTTDLKQSTSILKSALFFANLFNDRHTVAGVLSPFVCVEPNLQASRDAACLSMMAMRGTIKGGVVEGPVTLDTALCLVGLSNVSLSVFAGKVNVLFACF